MTVEMLEELRKKCVFVPDWECSIEASEIPLEVCKTCLEARKVHSAVLKITRHVTRAETISAENEVISEAEVPQIVSPR